VRVLTVCHVKHWWRRGEFGCCRRLITRNLLILNCGKNAKYAVSATSIHVEFTLRGKAVAGRSVPCPTSPAPQKLT
jgi:hypothetical protein